MYLVPSASVTAEIWRQIFIQNMHTVFTAEIIASHKAFQAETVKANELSKVKRHRCTYQIDLSVACKT